VGETSNAASALAWIVVSLWFGVVFVGILTHDFRTQPLAGDTASHLMQALSVSRGDHQLAFGAEDLRQWKEMGWTGEPVGMFFQRYDGDQFGLAKPYGYSAYSAPFVAGLGAVRGMAVANALLLALLVALSIALLRTRYEGPVVPIAVGAFYLTSYAYMYAYWSHSELFLALVTLVAFFAVVRYSQTESLPWAFVAFAVMGFGVSEKLAFAALFGPLCLVVLWRVLRWRERLALVATGLGVFALAVLPYLHYSDWESVTPYGGHDRSIVTFAAPFAGATAGFAELGSFDGEGLWGAFGERPGDKILAGVYTLVGRHTGLAVYIPVALLLLVAGVARIRRTDAWGRAGVLAVLSYLAFYAVLFPTNYFGGGQTLGNRYFLQAAPAVLAMVVLVGVGRRALLSVSVAGAALGLMLMWPHHADPGGAHVYIERTSRLQVVLPFEANQDTAAYFRCSKYVVRHITVCDEAAAVGK
jgi:hypothetical protein